LILMLIVTRQLQIPLAEFEITFARSSGPGGQNVNKVNSKAVLRWPVRGSLSLPEAVRQRFLQKYGNRLTTEGELLVTSQRYRDAWRNSQDCLEKLRVMLLGVVHPPKRRRATRPTRGSVERRLQAKRRQSSAKQDRRLRGDD
jgi:ribosome-associated protein